MPKRNDPLFKKVLPVAALASILAMVALLMGLALTRSTDDRAAAALNGTPMSCRTCDRLAMRRSSNRGIFSMRQTDTTRDVDSTRTCISQDSTRTSCLLVNGNVTRLIGNSYSCSTCYNLEKLSDEVYCLDSDIDVCKLVSIDDAGLDVQAPDAAEPTDSIQESSESVNKIMPPIPSYEGYICKEDSSKKYSSKMCTYPGSQLTVMPPAKATKCTVIDPKYYTMNTRPMVPDGPIAYCCPSNTVYDSFKQQCVLPTTVPARTGSGSTSPIYAPSPMPVTPLNVERAE